MQANGPCSQDPDLWYPEMPRGRPNPAVLEKVASKIVLAIEICERCPFRWPCQKQGMEEDNLPWGIWGGKMAGERLMESGHKLEDFSQESDERKAIELTVRITPYVRWQSATL